MTEYTAENPFVASNGIKVWPRTDNGVGDVEWRFGFADGLPPHSLSRDAAEAVAEFRRQDPKDPMFKGVKNVVLEHREGEYVHLRDLTGENHVFQFSDGGWYLCYASGYPEPRSRGDMDDRMGWYTVISHGFLTGTVSPAIPEIGRWIKATMKDGSVKTFKVTKAHKYHDVAVFLQANVSAPDDFYINLDPCDNDDQGRWVESWEYVDRPWKVGDIVRPGDTVRVPWLGIQVNHSGNAIVRFGGEPETYMSSGGPECRINTWKIVWISEEETK